MLAHDFRKHHLTAADHFCSVLVIRYYIWGLLQEQQG